MLSLKSPNMSIFVAPAKHVPQSFMRRAVIVVRGRMPCVTSNIDRFIEQSVTRLWRVEREGETAVVVPFDNLPCAVTVVVAKNSKNVGCAISDDDDDDGDCGGYLIKPHNRRLLLPPFCWMNAF